MHLMLPGVRKFERYHNRVPKVVFHPIGYDLPVNPHEVTASFAGPAWGESKI